MDFGMNSMMNMGGGSMVPVNQLSQMSPILGQVGSMGAMNPMLGGVDPLLQNALNFFNPALNPILTENVQSVSMESATKKKIGIFAKMFNGIGKLLFGSTTAVKLLFFCFASIASIVTGIQIFNKPNHKMAIEMSFIRSFTNSINLTTATVSNKEVILSSISKNYKLVIAIFVLFNVLLLLFLYQLNSNQSSTQIQNKQKIKTKSKRKKRKNKIKLVKC